MQICQAVYLSMLMPMHWQHSALEAGHAMECPPYLKDCACANA